MMRNTDPEVQKLFLEHRTRLRTAVCLVATLAAAIAFSFPYLAEKAGGGHTFLFFCIMMCIQLIFVWKIMPETKGKSLEQIEHTLVLH